MKTPYSTDKIIHHPQIFQECKDRAQPNPVTIHFMPALACNQSCSFCAYGHRKPEDGPEQRGWKNMAMMSDAFMPAAKMRECTRDWHAMGVKAIEVTGGGEPLIYPHIDEFFQLAAEYNFDIGLVTNGTALTEKRANIFNLTNWKWARVSIDAGDPEEYVKTRRVPKTHWNLAWEAVERLAARKDDPEQRVGVGFVVDHTNYEGVYSACAKAKARGADNVRISTAFTPHHLNRFPSGSLAEALRQAKMAKKDMEEEGFQVNDLLSERITNLADPAQTYQYCMTKDVLCVVGGDCNVYTCCTLAFNPRGLIGSIATQSFADLWHSIQKQLMFMDHDARRICKVECLYERRNKNFNRLAKLPLVDVEAMRKASNSIHRNFI